jgi:hypothetical protein
MPSDYASIAAQNRTKYGTDIGRIGEVLLARLYSDRTHFAYELLQNAEDAHASSVSFHLRRDRLEMTHNGRLFTEQDVRGVCGIVEGTKSDDLTTIGRFGIGFKSVYAYTSSPQIHSGDEHFWIEDYVIPHPIEARRTKHQQTVLIFPFDRADTPRTDAFRDIAARLENLGTRTLLFLRHIEGIEWTIEDGSSGTYLRETQLASRHRMVTLVGEGKQESIDELWLVYGHQVPISDGADLLVEAAFRVQDSDASGERVIAPCEKSELVVFFPTEKETHLNFLIHGPYRTTPARDNIPETDALNQMLVRETATLVAASLGNIRDLGLLSVSCLEALPLNPAAFPPGSMFRPIYDAVSDALRTEPLLPTADSSYVPATSAVLARGLPIRHLLDGQQLRGLLQSDVDVRWLHPSITQDRTPELRSYLLRELGISEVDPEWFARRVDTTFFEAQTDEWMIKLYRLLLRQESLWRGLGMPVGSSFRGPILDKPFVRLEDGRHVAPFSIDDRPYAYISNVADPSIPIVRLSIAADDDARSFLTKLGLTEPDIVVDIIERILPRYRGDAPFSISYDEHIAHLGVMGRALDTTVGKRRIDLLSAIRRTPFLRAQDISKAVTEFKRPEDVYIRSPEMEMYFSSSTSVRFAGEQYRVYYAMLEEFGASRTVRTTARPTDASGYVTIASNHGDHERGLNGFDPDFRIDGLERALRYPNRERSSFIWNQLLRPNVKRLHGEVERASVRNYANKTTEEKWSVAGSLARANAWIPDHDGFWHQPQELTLKELPEDFEQDELLAEKLGMISGAVTLLAKEVGVDASMLEFVLRNTDAIQALMRQQLQIPITAEADETDDDPAFDYDHELDKAFSRAGITSISDDWLAPGPVPHPERRRDAVAAQISATIDEALPVSRMFQVVPKKRWQAKDNSVRAFLLEEYQGKCQICHSTFPRRDGEPYFEALYLVSRVKAKWLDRRGNVLCLCATCCAKFLHGSIEAESITKQVDHQRLVNEGGSGHPGLEVTLCGKTELIRFSERHLLDLQEIIKAVRNE